MSQEPSAEARAKDCIDAIEVACGVNFGVKSAAWRDACRILTNEFETVAAQAVAAHARGPEIYVTEGGTLVIAENGDEFEIGSDGSMSGGNLEDYKYIRLLPEITKQLSPEQLRLFPLAAHAREPDEATIGIVAEVLLGNWPLAETVVRKLREASLVAIGPVPQDKNAILDEVFAAISPTTVRNERIIRGLKSEKTIAPTPPERRRMTGDDIQMFDKALHASSTVIDKGRLVEATPPADDEPLCVICGEPWPCTCGSPHAKPTPPAAERANSHSHIIDQARYWLSRIDTRDPDLHRLLLERNMVVTSLVGERAKPAASDEDRLNLFLARIARLHGDKYVQAFRGEFAQARREAAVDMRKRQIEALRGKAKAEKAQGYDGGWAARAANWLACDDLPLRALPLTEEETP